MEAAVWKTSITCFYMFFFPICTKNYGTERNSDADEVVGSGRLTYTLTLWFLSSSTV